MKQHGSIEINRPIDEVFEYTINNVAQWSHTVVEDEVIQQKPGHVGSTFRCVTGNDDRRIEFQGVVTRHEPPYASASHLTGQPFDIEVEYIFKNLGVSTRVTQYSTVSPKGFLRVIFFLFGWMMNKASCKVLDAELNNLKRLLEEGAGRTSD